MELHPFQHYGALHGMAWAVDLVPWSFLISYHRISYFIGISYHIHMTLEGICIFVSIITKYDM